MSDIRRRFRDAVTFLALPLLLSSCGDGSPGGGVAIGSPTPGPTGGGALCSLSARQQWAQQVMAEWYLFPETLPGYVDPSAFRTLDDYIDALTATARAQGRDRYFTHVASIAAETAYYESGEAAGFGIRLHVDGAARRLFVTEAFEDAPALAAGIDRGDEILAVGTSLANLRSVSDIMLAGGEAGLYDALGPSSAGVARALRIRNRDGAVRDLSVTKGVFEIAPVSSRYGVRVIDDAGRKVGYVNLRTFIYTAEPALREAFAQLKAQGVDEVIVDLRYNGGGLVSVAQTFGSLMGGAMHGSDLFALMRYRPEKSAENEQLFFLPEADAIAPRKIAFIGTDATASASELVINAFRAYLHADVALIGSNTYGKPVGQIAIDREQCDDRLRVIAFATENAEGDTGYFNGLAPLMTSTCRAEDDVTEALGDPAEDSVARALDFLDGRACTPIGGMTLARQRLQPGVPAAPALQPLMPAEPTLPQRDMPGFF